MSQLKETIYIIDDDKSVRRSLSLFLKASGYYTETFESADEFLQLNAYEGYGCIILDINMDGKTGIELQEELIKLQSNLPIIFITGMGDIEKCVLTLKRGAINFLEKPFKEEALLNSIQEAINLLKKRSTLNNDIQIAKNLVNLLTQRESEILTYLLAGLLNKEIASALHIAEQTVKLHRQSIAAKFGVKSVAEIVLIANKAGISAITKPMK
jgi:two-component system, LuxR family, response regulator FixJ